MVKTIYSQFNFIADDVRGDVQISFQVIITIDELRNYTWVGL